MKLRPARHGLNRNSPNGLSKPKPKPNNNAGPVKFRPGRNGLNRNSHNEPSKPKPKPSSSAGLEGLPKPKLARRGMRSRKCSIGKQCRSIRLLKQHPRRRNRLRRRMPMNTNDTIDYSRW